MRRILPVVISGVLLSALPLPAQQTAGFSMANLQLPQGFFDLSDVILTTDDRGLVTVTATTRLGNAEAHVLIAGSPPIGGAPRRLIFAIKPTHFSITEMIPALSNPVLDNLDFSNVALVITDQDINQHSSELQSDLYDFYSEVYKSDDFTLVLKPGINLIAAIPAENLPPNSPLIAVMDALGIEKGTILLQGTLGKSLTMLTSPGAGGAGALKDLYLRAELPPMHPAGSPAWFRSGQLALELTGAPSVRLVGEMNVFIDETDLQFFLAAALAKSGMSLAGGLNSTDGWQQPFGIPWLILNNITLAIGLSPGGITPGFAAKMVIGKKDLDVAISMTFTPAGAPSSMMFKGASQTGFGISDLVELQARMAAARDAAAKASGGTPPPAVPIPVDMLPNIDFRDVALQFAPKDAPELGVEKGMKIKGEMWLPTGAGGSLTNFAAVDIGVTEDGLWARGHLNAFTLGPLVWDDALLDFSATRAAQHLIMKGDVTLFGARQAVDLTLTREQLAFSTRTRVFDAFSADLDVHAAFNLQHPDFQVDAVASADFSSAVGPLVQQGIVGFVAAAADVTAVARRASNAAEQALAIPQATVDQLRRALEAQRDIAAQAVNAATTTANARRATMSSAWATRNAAWSNYARLPALPVARKAQALAAYHGANATYLQRAAAYSASMAYLAATQRIYNAIPPVDQNIQLMRAEAAIAELRTLLRTAQQNLARAQQQFDALEEALARGEQLLVIERAEFHGGLQSAMNGQAMHWDITGQFAGAPFEMHQTMDFSNVGEGAAHLVQALLQR